MWARYERLQFHGAINTNNHAEALNRAVKCVLKQRPNWRLDSLVKMWFAQVMPRFQQRCLEENIESHRFLAMPLPPWAFGLPKRCLLVLLDNAKRACEAGEVQPAADSASVTASHQRCIQLSERLVSPCA